MPLIPISSGLEDHIHRMFMRVRLGREVIKALSKWTVDNYYEDNIQISSHPETRVRLAFHGSAEGPFACRMVMLKEKSQINPEEVIFSTLRSKVFHLPYWGMQVAIQAEKADEYAMNLILSELREKFNTSKHILWSPWSEFPVEFNTSLCPYPLISTFAKSREDLLAKTTKWAIEELAYHRGINQRRANIAIIGSSSLATKITNQIKNFVQSDCFITSNAYDLKTAPEPRPDLCIFADIMRNLTADEFARLGIKTAILLSPFTFTEEIERYCRQNKILVLPAIIIQGVEELAMHFGPCDPKGELLEQRWRKALQVLLLEARDFEGNLFNAAYTRAATALRTYLQI